MNMSLQNFDNTYFTNGVDNLTSLDNDNKVVMVMFSKRECKYCNLCINSYIEAANELKDENYILAKIECDEYPDIVHSLKTNSNLLDSRMNITFPTFIIYKNNTFEKEYTGVRTKDDFILHIKDVDIEVSRLADKIQNIFPIKSDTLYNLYLTARNCFWIEKEIDFSKDKYDWDNKVSKDEKYFLENILSFFSQSDQIVNNNLEERFSVDIENLPKDLIIYTKLFYHFQIMMEDVHSQTYEILLDTYITDINKKSKLKRAIEHVPAIKKKSNWATKWIDDKEASFGTRLIAFAVLEGVFFSGSFCAIYWIREKNILNGLTKSNEFISRDEGLHYMFAIKLYNLLKVRDDYDIGCDNNTIIDIIKEAVEIEKEFITSSFSCNLIGMNSTEMKKYIEFVADKLLENLDIEKVYNTSNPFQFMENIGLQNKTNFFENRVTEYSRANAAGDNTASQLTLDDDF